MRDILIDPEFVSGTNVSPQSGAARSEDKTHDRVTIEGGRNCLAEFQIAKPDLLAGNLAEFFPAQVVQVEHQEVVFETWSHVRQL